jgi:hypothetical protein
MACRGAIAAINSEQHAVISLKPSFEKIDKPVVLINPSA